jgi:1-acyl-sn-glycerol-3-phosphate acyltransferase
VTTDATATDDPVTLRSPAMCRFFAGVMRRQVARGFRALRVARPGLPTVPPSARLIVYANHPSWWDPAIFIVLADTLFPGRAGFGPMDAEALARYRFMRRIGIFGVTPGSARGAAQFLRIGERILSDPARMLWLTSQGTFADPRVRLVELQKGLAHLMARVPGAVAVPLALEYPFWSEKRPEALAAFGPPVRADAGGRAALNATLTEALEATQDGLARCAIARDPAAFDRVLGGRAGVGGVYGGWQRLRDALAGRVHSPDHLSDAGRNP